MTSWAEKELLAVAQAYRDRADTENMFDELKNQWGWTGFSTQDLKRSQLMARIVALIYNWWSLFTRLASQDRHGEAITREATPRLVRWLRTGHNEALLQELACRHTGVMLADAMQASHR